MFPLLVDIFIVAAAGLIGGSFASALVWRIPQGLAWYGRERSQCTHCGHNLGSKDLIPVLSYCLQKGRCRYCHKNISKIYPLTETLSMLGCLGLYAVWGWGWPLLLGCFAISLLVAHLIIDIKHMILPDIINLLLGIIFAIILYFRVQAGHLTGAESLQFIITAIAFPLLMLLVSKIMTMILHKEVLGWGDVKFFVVVGLGLGFSGLPVYLMLSGIFGIIFGLIWRWRMKSDLFPFGPSIIISFYVCLILQSVNINMLFGL
jgi:leader peptidase (prepilin peptidase)/N-methyltransferase